MSKYLFVLCTAALFAIPTAAFSESIHVALGGVRVEPAIATTVDMKVSMIATKASSAECCEHLARTKKN